MSALDRPTETLNLSADQVQRIHELVERANTESISIRFDHPVALDASHAQVVTVRMDAKYPHRGPEDLWQPRRQGRFGGNAAEYLIDDDGTVLSAKGTGIYTREEHEEWEAEQDRLEAERRAQMPPSEAADDDVPF